MEKLLEEVSKPVEENIIMTIQDKKLYFWTQTGEKICLDDVIKEALINLGVVTDISLFKR